MKLDDLKPYRDIILFLIAMFGANYFWKFTVTGDETAGPVMWFGLNITAPFDYVAEWTARREFWWLKLIKDNVYLYNKTVVGFFNGTLTLTDDVRIGIVWGCTAIKQSFIWLVIMLLARGSEYDKKYSIHNWHKLWFVPFGLVCIYCFNVFRVTIIPLLIEHHHDMFDFWHEYVFKYLFYGMIFLLWVVWVEKIVKTTTKTTTDDTQIN